MLNKINNTLLFLLLIISTNAKGKVEGNFSQWKPLNAYHSDILYRYREQRSKYSSSSDPTCYLDLQIKNKSDSNIKVSFVWQFDRYFNGKSEGYRNIAFQLSIPAGSYKSLVTNGEAANLGYSGRCSGDKMQWSKIVKQEAKNA